MRRIPNSEHANMSHHYNDGLSAEKNYRPSPIKGGSMNGRGDAQKNPYDSHLRHYHRPYPTIRGGQTSPSRLDLETSPLTEPQQSGRHSRHNSGDGRNADLYETPMIHRASKSPSSKQDEKSSEGYPPNVTSNNPGTSTQHHPMVSRNGDMEGGHYSDRRGFAPDDQPPPPHPQSKAKHPYPPPHHNQGHHNYGKDPYQFGPPHAHQPPHMYHLQNGSGYYSPYDPHNPMNPMNRNHHPYHHAQYGVNHPYHPSVEGPYRHFQQHSHHPSMHQTPIDQPPGKRRRIDDQKSGKKGSSKQPKRKKMYSDFVGVTYNKTHAKYQACITHYRKQHYLGRYKLAVDAARAYDQSAKLLKGDGWKINFQTERDYEIAKQKELAMLDQRRMEADIKGGVNMRGNMGRMSQYDPASRMVKEKLGLRMPLSQDPSINAEKMLKDRLSAVAKQAADHADQLKQSGVDLTKKNKNVGVNAAVKKEDDSEDMVGDNF